MKNYKNKYIGGSIIALMLAPAVHAQDTSTDFALDEIVVTATRTETTLQKTAVAVTAISGADLERSNIRNLQDVASFVPSLSIGNRAGEGAAGGAVSIRAMGVDSQDSSAAVGTYIDDVYWASEKGNLLGLMDVERVEVLRGPQGTLFGRNTIAGAIQYITVAPGDEFEGYIKGSVGSMNTNEIAGAVNVPVSDNLSVRVAGIYRENDGWVKDETNGGNLGSADSSALRARAKWQPSDRFTADLKFERVEQNSEGNPTLIDNYENNSLFVAIGNNNLAILGGIANLPPALQPFPVVGPVPGPNIFDDSIISTDNLNPNDYTTDGVDGQSSFAHESNQYSLSMTYDLSDNLSLKSITAYSEYTNKLQRDIDGTPLPIIHVIFPEEEGEVLTQELRLKGKLLDDRLDFTTGVYYYDGQELQTPQVTTIGDPNFQQLARPSAPFGPKRTNESISVFAQGSYGLTEALKVTLGYRYTDEDVTAQEQQGQATSPVQKFNFKDSSPYFGLDYQATDNAMVYAKASKGFRAGGRKADSALIGGGINFDPDTAWTYEGGLRLEAASGRLRFNPTVYFTDWKDIQFLNTISSPITGAPAIITQNAGDAEIKGLELETLFAAHPDLVFRGSYSYMDTSYSRVEPITTDTYPNGVSFVAPPGFPPVIPVGAVQEIALSLDSVLPRAPKHKISVGATHTYDLESGADIVTSVDYSWIDEQRSVTRLISPILPSYGLMNGRIQYNAPSGVWSIAAYGKNMTNEYYLDGSVDFAADFTVGTKVDDVGKPREFGVAAAFNF